MILSTLRKMKKHLRAPIRRKQKSKCWFTLTNFMGFVCCMRHFFRSNTDSVRLMSSIFNGNYIHLPHTNTYIPDVNLSMSFFIRMAHKCELVIQNGIMCYTCSRTQQKKITTSKTFSETYTWENISSFPVYLLMYLTERRFLKYTIYFSHKTGFVLHMMLLHAKVVKNV